MSEGMLFIIVLAICAPIGVLWVLWFERMCTSAAEENMRRTAAQVAWENWMEGR